MEAKKLAYLRQINLLQISKLFISGMQGHRQNIFISYICNAGCMVLFMIEVWGLWNYGLPKNGLSTD
jgi:hypothetical protein